MSQRDLWTKGKSKLFIHFVYFLLIFNANAETNEEEEKEAEEEENVEEEEVEVETVENEGGSDEPDATGEPADQASGSTEQATNDDDDVANMVMDEDMEQAALKIQSTFRGHKVQKHDII